MKSNIENNIPLCVDLDGTLIYSDCLHESILLAVKRRPWLILYIPFWLITGGIVAVKSNIYKYASPNPLILPYNEDILNYIREEKSKGRKIILATASMQEIADSISDHLGIFDDVIGTSAKNNLRRKKKLEALEEKFGKKGFDYIGDSFSDIDVWKGARKAILVNPKRNIQKQAEFSGNVDRIFKTPKNKLKLIIKEIRVYQWVKNLLIFLPMFLAHHFYDFYSYLDALIAFFSFSFTASSVYVLNDMMDIEADREHPKKKERPFASGELSIQSGVYLIPVLLLLGFGIAAVALPLQFLSVLFMYYILTTAYSFYLKRVYVLDLIILATLYTIRLLAGAVATDVIISTWAMAFSMFLFLSLALVKRFTEIKTSLKNKKKDIKGRGYRISDIDLIRSAGTSSGLLSVVILALYLNSNEVLALYDSPNLLYLIAPLLLFWILRIWFKTDRGEMTDDPIVFTVKDLTSYIVGFLIALIIIGASL